jgi:tRNA G18 (ribose-2'-O)-methylase SpoU
LCDDLVMIPQRGKKESLNVAVAAAVAMYALASRRPA